MNLIDVLNMGKYSSHRKSFILFTTAVLLTFFILHIQQQNTYQLHTQTIIKLIGDEYEKEIPHWLKQRNETSNLKPLGRMLFFNEAPPQIAKNDKVYQILVWKYGPQIENRHLKQFSSKKVDPFRKCSVKNCIITYNDTAIKTADIVIFHLHRMKGIEDLPKTPRNPQQIWTFLTDESPHHTFLKSKVKLTDFNGIFNWSMTYRMDSDIPVPYGRTILKKQSQKNLEFILNKRRDVLVAIMGSNCGGHNHRWDYVKQLQKYIKVDVYGTCGPLKCPGHFRSDCNAIDNYMFYLAFENSNCDEYITEKLWWNAFRKNSIPIVMGATTQSYAKLLPVKSYLNIDDFANPSALAEYIYHLNKTGEYQSFYRWKGYFEVLNEHGYFQSDSYHYCRICEALNYNHKDNKTYDDLGKFWSVQKDCHPAWNT